MGRPTSRRARRSEEQAPQRAEVSNFEIVNHWFTLAADRLEIPDDVARRPQLVLPRGAGADPGPPERRQDPRLLRLPRPAQRRARPVQGRHPLPPRGGPRRGARARVADDVEDARSSNIPYGGAKGGVNCNPQRARATASSRRSPARSWTRSRRCSARRATSRRRTSGTNAQTMAWIMDEYGKLHGHTPAIVTGKPIALEGSYGREAATGRGVVYMFEEAAKEPASSPTDARFVVQGYGNVGSWAARLAARAGLQARRRLGRRGRDPQRRRASTPTSSHSTVSRGRQACRSSRTREGISPDELLETECEVFIPAALGGMIHKANADQLNCKLIVEGANSPTTPAGRRDPRRQGRLRRPGRDGERRRRRRLVLRVGPEPAALPLGPRTR